MYKGSIQAGISWGIRPWDWPHKQGTASGRLWPDRWACSAPATWTLCTTCSQGIKTQILRLPLARSRSTASSLEIGLNISTETWPRPGKSPKTDSSKKNTPGKWSGDQWQHSYATCMTEVGTLRAMTGGQSQAQTEKMTSS